MEILILTTRNSARSQMLEGWLRYYLNDIAHVQSAGLEHAKLDAFAVKAMMEAVVDIRVQKAKELKDVKPSQFDYVFALTNEAFVKASELFSDATVEKVEIDDPAKAKGNEMERLKVYRKTVDAVDDFAFAMRMRLIS